MCLRICGHDKSAPTPADGLQQRCEQIAIYTRTPTKCPQNIPPGVGADSSRPYPNITKYTYPHYQIRISTLPHTHFPSPFRGYLRICGHDKSDPYSCERSATTLRTNCNIHTYTHVIPYFRTTNTILSHRKNHTFTPQKPYFCTTNTILSHHKHHTFAPQKPYFRTAKTILSHRKNHTFTPQIPYFRTAKTYRRQIGRVAKTFC